MEFRPNGLEARSEGCREALLIAKKPSVVSSHGFLGLHLPESLGQADVMTVPLHLAIRSCSRSSENLSDEPHSPGSEGSHFQQQESVSPTVDVCIPISSVAVSNRHIHDFEVAFGSSE